MIFFNIRGWFLLVALLLSACAGNHHSGKPTAWVKPGTAIVLPAPGIAQKIEQQQLLTIEARGQQHTLLVLLQADEKQISLAGLSPLGIRLFALHYDAAGISTEQSVAGPELPPANQVLADIMLSYWPVAAWQNLLPPGWQLEEDAYSRRLTDPDGKVVTRITYLQKNGQRLPARIWQNVFHYQISINTLDR